MPSSITPYFRPGLVSCRDDNHTQCLPSQDAPTKRYPCPPSFRDDHAWQPLAIIFNSNQVYTSSCTSAFSSSVLPNRWHLLCADPKSPPHSESIPVCRDIMLNGRLLCSLRQIFTFHAVFFSFPSCKEVILAILPVAMEIMCTRGGASFPEFRLYLRRPLYSVDQAWLHQCKHLKSIYVFPVVRLISTLGFWFWMVFLPRISFHHMKFSFDPYVPIIFS